MEKLTDHSRVCGKNRIVIKFGYVPVGSLPRVREKLLNPTISDLVIGITPACAGKTTF